MSPVAEAPRLAHWCLFVTTFSFFITMFSLQVERLHETEHSMKKNLSS